jgi:hypothetical protein
VQSNDLGGQNALGVLKVCPLLAPPGLIVNDRCKFMAPIKKLFTLHLLRPVTLLILTTLTWGYKLATHSGGTGQNSAIITQKWKFS